MANAGASIVQVYTHFGYRGVGTPRLLKDELASLLGSSTWKANIGSEYHGVHMGWDEKRLFNEADALKAEAQGLGDMLRKQWHKDDMARLVAEAEAAIAGTASRDNLAGSAAPKGQEENSGQAIEASASPTRIEAAPIDVLQTSNALEAAPEPIPLVDQPGITSPTARNEWRDHVQSSQRRLV